MLEVEKEEVKKEEEKVAWDPSMDKRLEQIVSALIRLYQGKIKRFTVMRYGPIQEK